MLQNYICAVLGFIFGVGATYLWLLLRKEMVINKDLRRKAKENRRLSKQKDTEFNTARRFQNALCNFLPSPRFWTSGHSEVGGGAFIVNVGEKGCNSFLTITVSLADPEDPPVKIQLRWPSKEWSCGIDNESIDESVNKLRGELRSRYPLLIN
jgi:hypothetical protein